MNGRNAGGHRRLPSLDLIRGFEAAARNLSFTRAAQELSLTQSAVSRQVQALEAHLGVELFRRGHRTLTLTEAGQTLHAAAAEAMRQIREATARIRDATRMLTLTTTFGFASIWLIPRLARFRARHPDTDVRVSARNEMVNLERERIDLAVRYCAPEAAGAGAVKLFDDEVLPVCSPALLQGAPLAQPADLAGQVLLHLDFADARVPVLSWRSWLEAEGLGELRPAGELRFGHYDQVIQAAVDAQGVALGSAPLLAQLLGSGKLVAPFDRRRVSPRAYFVVVPDAAAARAEVRQFVDWLVEEARNTPLSAP